MGLPSSLQLTAASVGEEKCLQGGVGLGTAEGTRSLNPKLGSPKVFDELWHDTIQWERRSCSATRLRVAQSEQI